MNFYFFSVLGKQKKELFLGNYSGYSDEHFYPYNKLFIEFFFVSFFFSSIAFMSPSSTVFKKASKCKYTVKELSLYGYPLRLYRLLAFPSCIGTKFSQRRQEETQSNHTGRYCVTQSFNRSSTSVPTTLIHYTIQQYGKKAVDYNENVYLRVLP